MIDRKIFYTLLSLIFTITQNEAHSQKTASKTHRPVKHTSAKKVITKRATLKTINKKTAFKPLIRKSISKKATTKSTPSVPAKKLIAKQSTAQKKKTIVKKTAARPVASKKVASMTSQVATSSTIRNTSSIISQQQVMPTKVLPTAAASKNVNSSASHKPKFTSRTEKATNTSKASHSSPKKVVNSVKTPSLSSLNPKNPSTISRSIHKTSFPSEVKPSSLKDSTRFKDSKPSTPPQNPISKKSPKDILLDMWESLKREKITFYNISIFTLLDDTERDKVIDLVLEKKGDREALKTQALQHLLEIKLTNAHSWEELRKLGASLNECIDKVVDLIKKQSATKKPINLQMIIMPFITKEIDTLRVKNAMNILNVDETTTRTILRFAKQANIADIKLAQKYYDYADVYITTNAPVSFSDGNTVREVLSFILSQEALTTSSHLVDPQLRLNVAQFGFYQYARRYLNDISKTWDTNQDVDTNLNNWLDHFLIKESDDMWDQYSKIIDTKVKKVEAAIVKDLTDPTQVLTYWEWDDVHNKLVRRNETLNKDYIAVQDELFKFQLEEEDPVFPNDQPLQFNWSIFIADPFLSDIRESKLPQTVTDLDIAKICEKILSCGTYGFDDKESIKNAFEKIKSTTYNQPERSHTLRKRMVRLVEYYTKGQTALDPNEGIAYSKLGQLIAQNDSHRCIDGIDQWLSDTETTSIYKVINNNTSATLRFARDISSILVEKKISHIRSHIPPADKLQLPNDHANLLGYYNFQEIGTYAPLLLTQRLRLGFGLPIAYSSTKNLLLMSPCGVSDSEMKDIYDPVNVISRFFKGGSITFTQKIDSFPRAIPTSTTATVQFKPFTPNTFIGDIHQAWVDNILNNETVKELILKDKVLRKAYLDSSDGTGGDKYFDLSSMDKKDTFKPTVFKRLLTKTGYIVDLSELD